ncbi:Extracellular endo-alpha-(1-_5)-L-arabinanase 2 precursor [compost metagenome]
MNHGKDISTTIKKSSLINFNDNGTISGSVSGTWRLKEKHRIELVINGVDYHGVFVRQWDEGTKTNVMTFTALSNEGEAVWGSHTASSN